MPIPRKTSLTLSDIRFSGGSPFRTAREHKEALSLILRLAVSAGVAVADLALNAVTLEALTGGRSVAHVFKLTPFFGPDRLAKGSPVVVKIAPRARSVNAGVAEQELGQCVYVPRIPCAAELPG